MEDDKPLIYVPNGAKVNFGDKALDPPKTKYKAYNSDILNNPTLKVQQDNAPTENRNISRWPTQFFTK